MTLGSRALGRFSGEMFIWTFAALQLQITLYSKGILVSSEP
jgi:hypothetical protein